MSEPQPARLIWWIRRIILVTSLSILALTALTYGLDYVVFRYRVAASQQPYGSVTVQHYYAVQQKSGKVTYIFDPPQPETCVHAVFPHGGYTPCWYLTRHPESRTDI
jgi:hypothetical protein